MATKKTIPIKPLTSWSFSRYNDYRNCPLKAKLKHIDRIKEPPNAAMDRGNAIHKMAEDYVKGLLRSLPAELKPLEKEFRRLAKLYKSKKLPMIVEDNWAFTATWDETQWNDWVGCWVRIKLDCAHYETPNLMVVTDWKTGKPSDFKTAEYMEQLELYALAALLMAADPAKVTIKPRIGWVDTGTFFPAEGDETVSYTAKDILKLKKAWTMRVRGMMNDTTFAPRPNRLCGWCYFGQAGKAKGGPGLCKF